MSTYKEGYRYDVIHPETGKPCKEPLMGYRFPKETMESLIETSVIELDGRPGSYDVKPLFPEYKKPFDNPRPVRLLNSFIPFLAKDSNDIVLGFFFSDGVAKTNTAAILEQNGINHVRSL